MAWICCAEQKKIRIIKNNIFKLYVYIFIFAAEVSKEKKKKAWLRV